MSAQNENSANAIGVSALRERRDFLRLRNGRRFSTKNLTLQSDQSDPIAQEEGCRVGYTVTTRVGNAVERNRIKRRLRAAVSRVFPESASAGFDYAILARRACLTAKFDSITSDLRQALDHVHTNRAKGSKPKRKDRETG